MVFKNKEAHCLLQKVGTADKCTVVRQGGDWNEDSEAGIKFGNGKRPRDTTIPDHHTGIIKQWAGVDVVNEDFLTLLVCGIEMGIVAGRKGSEEQGGSQGDN